MTVKKQFRKNGWTNNWKSGVFTYHHYHSNTHEALAVIGGSTRLQLGGDNGIVLTVRAGDVIVIPAGVAHRNLGKENDITCIGGYPEGRDYNMNYGKPGERPGADRLIESVPVPSTDPLYGNKGLPVIWSSYK